MSDEKLTDYGYGAVPTMPVPQRERPWPQENPEAQASLDKARREEQASANLREYAAKLIDDNGGAPVALITTNGRRIGPFAGEVLVSALANHPGAAPAEV